MKITRFLPKKLAQAYQRHSLERLENELQYHLVYVHTLEELIWEAKEEMRRLEKE